MIIVDREDRPPDSSETGERSPQVTAMLMIRRWVRQECING
jgi:hypothetical protein